MWPAPYDFDNLVKELEADKKIIKIVAPYKGFYQERFIPTIQSNPTAFSADEKGIIDDVISKYSDYWAKEISVLSHEDMPWKLANDLEEIDYTLVKQREPKFSRIYQEARKDETFNLIKSWWMFDDLSQEPDLYDEYR